MSEHLKRFKAPDSWHISKKTNKFITKTAPGPHNANALPVAVWLRDQMGFARNMKEVKQILHQRDVIVNGRACRDPKMGIGIFDIVSLPKIANTTGYSAIRTAGTRPSRSMPRQQRPASARSATRPLSQTEKSRLNMRDGSNILGDNTYKPKDSVVLSIDPESRFKIVDHFPVPLETWQW